MACSVRQLLSPTFTTSYPQHSSSLALSPPNPPFFATTVGERKSTFLKLPEFYSHRNLIAVSKASSGNEGIVSPNDDPENGVSLGTMKLPVDTDLQRFESLLFQWANSLCQGANLPLPVPLKVDKIAGGARLGFITVGDGKTEVLVYIDCLVFPASNGFPPMFRAIRNGTLKANPPPGEPRIMRSLLQALQKSIEIARLRDPSIETPKYV